MQTQIRQLRYRLVQNYCRTGELLKQLCGKAPRYFPEIISDIGLSMPDAVDCMSLYEQWAHYDAAEMWWHDRGGHAPRTPSDAVALLSAWKGNLH